MPAELTKELLYVTGNSVHKVTGNSGHLEHWSKAPDSVLFNEKLSLAARCVYFTLNGSAHHGSIVKLGQRRIADKLGIHQETVGLALKELADSGLIKISGRGQSRRSYSLRPPLLAEVPSSAKPAVSCPVCGQDRSGLLRTGICRSCSLDRKLNLKVDRAVDKRLSLSA